MALKGQQSGADLAELGRDAGLHLERTIGAKLRQLRTSRGWSQQYVADRLSEIGWPQHQSTVQKLEAGQRPMRVAEMAALASLYELPAVGLLLLPFPGEPLALAQRREHLARLDELIEGLEKNMAAMFRSLAQAQADRVAVIESMRDESEGGDESGKSQKKA